MSNLSRFDKSLFALKLQEPAIRMHAETASRRLQVHGECQKAGRSKGTGLFVSLIDGDLEVVRKYLEDVDRICREVRQTQGNPVTAEFLRGCLLLHVTGTLEVRASAIKGSIDKMAARMHLSHSLQPVHMHLARRSAR